MTSFSQSVLRFNRLYWLVTVVCFLLLAPACRASDSIYDFSLVQMDGSVVSLSSYKGKVVLIVNLARNSTFSDQISSLNNVYQAYKDKGLIVIGVPSNDFGAQEPGTDAEIKKAYTELHPIFPVMTSVSVRGKDEAPLFGFLTSSKDKSLSGEIHWNFTKFIVDRAGQVVARFAPDIDPDSPQMKLTLEKVLAGTSKKANDTQDDQASSKEDDDNDPER